MNNVYPLVIAALTAGAMIATLLWVGPPERPAPRFERVYSQHGDYLGRAILVVRDVADGRCWAIEDGGKDGGAFGPVPCSASPAPAAGGSGMVAAPEGE